jgi:NAD+ kinase
MHLSTPPPQRIAIVAHPSLSGAPDEAKKIESVLQAAGITTGIWPLVNDESLRQRLAAGEFDMLVALGGDGTMLRAGHLCGPLGVPILGINLGHFGFLTEVKREGWPEILPDLIGGHFRLEDRMMLIAKHRRGEQSLGRWEVLNEVVVCRGMFVRPVTLWARVDGYLLATYVADGLIAATPTGSTAYALASGGPILPPELRNILIVPVAPHLSVDRAIILPEGACVTITVRTSHDAVFSVDGQPPVAMQDGDEIHVGASEHAVRFVRFQDPGYFYRNLTHYMEQNPTAGSEA